VTKEERAVMQMALDALENHAGNYKLSDEGCDKHERACDSLRAELKKPDLVTTAEELLFKEMRYIATISTGQVNRVAKQAIWATRIVKGGVDEISEGEMT
jgi:hypothetical protein